MNAWLRSLSVAVMQIGHWFAFAAWSTLAIPRLILQPSRWLAPFYQVFIGGLPLAIVLGCALGAVIWMHTRSVLERFPGATELMPTVLTSAVLLELAPIGAGLIVAARTGASLGSELAAMKVTEQLDALEVLGHSIRREVVAPRIFACLLSVPILHILVSTLAIGSGYLGEMISGGGSWLKYSTSVEAELASQSLEFLLAALKTGIFGFLIGVTGCYLGIHSEPGSEGVAQAATGSVVACCLLVLAADVWLVGFITAILNILR